jgi:hypothetical protein
MDSLSFWTNLVVSVISLIIAVLALIMSYRSQKKSNYLQEQITKIEVQREKERQQKARKASLRPRLQKSDNLSHRLFIINDGEAEARNIRVIIDGKPLEQHCAAIQMVKLPPNIGPGAEWSCLLAITMDCHPPFDIEIWWDDAHNKNRSYRTSLN